MRIDVFTIFPELVDGYCSASLLGRARQHGSLDLRVRDLRSAADDPRRSVDDAPFGGGAGHGADARAALRRGRGGRGGRGTAPAAAPARPRRAAASTRRWPPSWRPLPAGSRCSAGATRGSTSGWPTTWSTGSSRSATSCWPAASRPPWWSSRRSPACCPGCSATRRRPTRRASADGLLEYPQYTRPAAFRGWAVPEVLRSGDHGAGGPLASGPGPRAAPLERRPDLIEARGGLSDDEVEPAGGGRARCACLADHGYHG